MASCVFWRLKEKNAFSWLPSIDSNSDTKQVLTLTKALDLDSLYFCHIDQGEEVSGICYKYIQAPLLSIIH